MHIKVKAVGLFLALALALGAFSGCGMKLSVDDTDSEAENSELISDSGTGTSTMDATVSIIQYMDNAPLNESCEGVKRIFDDAGIAYDVTVGSEHSEREDCEQKARETAINSTCDLVVCIGTPCAEAVCPIISSAGRLPVIFCAVTDPLGAGLVENLNKPGANCTGVATAFNINEQLNMINTFQPSITRLGVIYTESEQNTEEQLKTLQKAAEKLGITVYAEPIEDPSQMASVASDLMKKVEAVTLLPDNMTAKSSWNITNRSIVEQVPLYGVTLTQVNEGCLAGYTYDFNAIGRKAGELAVSVLRGESAADTPVIMEREGTLYVNSDRLKDLELEIPDTYKTAAVSVKTTYESKQ